MAESQLVTYVAIKGDQARTNAMVHEFELEVNLEDIVFILIEMVLEERSSRSCQLR